MIWLVGASGMLGTELGLALKEKRQSFVGTDSEVDITSRAALEAFANGKPFRWIVNCAAYTAVDKAEDDRDRCRGLNALGPENLGLVANGIGARVLHLSTDYVFDGKGQRPYEERDVVNPLTVYGQTKAEGERLLQQTCEDSLILRTAWLYGRYGPNFVATMLRLMRERDSVGVVADQQGAPTWAGDLANIISHILTSPPTTGGIFHASGEGQTTWYDFAVDIADEARSVGLLDPAKPLEIKPLGTSAYPTRAQRPLWSVLSKAKLNNELSLTFPHWRESLRHFLRQISTNP